MNSNSALATQVGVPASFPVGEIGKEAEVMHKNIESLRVLVGDLEGRLGPALAVRAEDAQASTSQPEPMRVPMAQTLYNLNMMIVEQECRIRSILNRVEL